MDSLGTFLSHEMGKYNALLARMEATLRELLRAVKGLVEMSPVLDAMYTSLINGQVPAAWAEVAYASLRPLASWNVDLGDRVAFMRRWLQRGEPPVFHLPAFYFPQGFLTGALQRHARRYALPINTLEFATRVMDWSVEEAVRDAEAELEQAGEQAAAAAAAGGPTAPAGAAGLGADGAKGKFRRRRRSSAQLAGMIRKMRRGGGGAGGGAGGGDDAGGLLSKLELLPERLHDVIPEDGVVVTGLYLECARWDAALGVITDAGPRELFSVRYWPVAGSGAARRERGALGCRANEPLAKRAMRFAS